MTINYKRKLRLNDFLNAYLLFILIKATERNRELVFIPD